MQAYRSVDVSRCHWLRSTGVVRSPSAPAFPRASSRFPRPARAQPGIAVQPRLVWPPPDCARRGRARTPAPRRCEGRDPQNDQAAAARVSLRAGPLVTCRSLGATVRFEVAPRGRSGRVLSSSAAEPVVPAPALQWQPSPCQEVEPQHSTATRGPENPDGVLLRSCPPDVERA